MKLSGNAGFIQNMNITAFPISVSTFNISMTVGNKVNIGYIHGTFIVFDEVQIQNSKKYNLVYGSFKFSSASGG